MNYKWSILVKTILENKHTIGGLIQPDFNTYFKKKQKQTKKKNKQKKDLLYATIIKPLW